MSFVFVFSVFVLVDESDNESALSRQRWRKFETPSTNVDLGTAATGVDEAGAISVVVSVASAPVAGGTVGSGDGPGGGLVWSKSFDDELAPSGTPDSAAGATAHTDDLTSPDDDRPEDADVTGKEKKRKRRSGGRTVTMIML